MSIYATLWNIQFQDPEDLDDKWIEITAQAVPQHIGSSPSYKEGDPYADFLPPVVSEDHPNYRAVVFVTNDTQKGTERNGQEYIDPLLVISGDEYAQSTFPGLLERIWVAMGRKGLGCTHDWEPLRAIAISPRDAAEAVAQQKVLGRVVPYEWCRRCGAIHHNFLGTRDPSEGP